MNEDFENEVVEEQPKQNDPRQNRSSFINGVNAGRKVVGGLQKSNMGRKNTISPKSTPRSSKPTALDNKRNDARNKQLSKNNNKNQNKNSKATNQAASTALTAATGGAVPKPVADKIVNSKLGQKAIEVAKKKNPGLRMFDKLTGGKTPKDESTKGQVKGIIEKLFPLLLVLLLVFVIMFIIFVFSTALYAKMAPIYEIVKWFENEDREITDLTAENSNQAKFLEKLEKYEEDASCELNMKVLLATLNYDDSLDKIYDEESLVTYEDENNEESEEALKDAKKRLKKLVNAMEDGNCSDPNEAYDEYLMDEYIPEYLTAYYTVGAENEEEQKQQIIDNIYAQVNAYEYWFEDEQCKVSGGTNCSYNVGGEIISGDIMVELLPCGPRSGDKTAVPTEVVDFQTYIEGVAYAETADFPIEAKKAQAIAARSFALTRHLIMGVNSGIGYQKDTNTIRLQNCTNDQVYCNVEEGCPNAVNSRPRNSYAEDYGEEAYEEFKAAMAEVAGMVLVDSATNEVQYANYTLDSGQTQWKNTANSGGDYYDALISYYSSKGEFSGINLDVTANCTAESGFSLGISGSTHLPITEYTRISSEYGVDRGDHKHGGIDYAAPAGNAIYAIGNATVDYAGWENAGNHSQGFGLYVRLGHNKQADGTYEYYSYYGHMSEILVKTGDTVNGGQQIGKVGNTGRSSGNHLHFEIRNSSRKPIDPNPTLEAIKAGQTTSFGDPNASSSNNSSTIAGSTSTLSSTVASGRAAEDIYYNQHDWKQEYCKGANMISTYPGCSHEDKPATIETSGCSVTSIAMVAATLNNNPSITPETVADWVCENTNYRINDNGTKSDLYSDSAMQEEFNIKTTSIDKSKSDDEIMKQVVEALESGKMIVASLADTGSTGVNYHRIKEHNEKDPGINYWATPGGHYVVLSSINEEGKIKVMDSASEERTGYYDQAIIKANYVGKIHKGIWIIEGKNQVQNGDACAPGNYSVAGDYANWKQFDPKWSGNRLGSSTIGDIGCAATSLAIQIARSGTKIDFNKLGSNEFNPATFVEWMNNNGGFDAEDRIYWQTPYTGGLVAGFELSEFNLATNNSSWSSLAQQYGNLIKEGYYLVSKVNYDGHYIAIDRVEGDTIYMFDPGSQSTVLNDEYELDGVTGVYLFKKTD